MKNSLFIFILVLVVISRFIGYSIDEIQPWDEGIYAHRISACLVHNEWLDQTEYSPNGLYSSSHPPLVIWINAIFDSYRIGTILFSVAIIILLGLMFKNRFNALVAILIFSFSSFLLFYSQHTQLDIPLAFFILLGLHFWNMYKKSSLKKYVLLTGIALGLGLWTKIFIAFFIPLTIFFDILFDYYKKKIDFKKNILNLLLITLIGIIIISPWFIFMGNKYGEDFFNYYFLFHLVNRSISGVEGNTKALGFLFYINQLIVILPLGISFITIFYKSLIKNHQNQIFIISFLLQILLFSLASTKLATYIIPSLVLLTYLAGNAFSENNLNVKLSKLQTIILLFFQTWSYFPLLRRNIENIDLVLIYDINYTMLIILGLIVLFFIYHKVKFKYVIIILIILQYFSFVYSGNHPAKFHGISYAAQTYNRIGLENLYHIRPIYKSEINNPQITFYFDLLNNDSINYYLYNLSDSIKDFKQKSMIIIEKGIETNLMHFNSLDTLEINDYYKILSNY